MTSACPDDDLVDRFVSGHAADDEQARIRSHLPGCASCRQLVSELARDAVAADATPDGETGGPLLRGAHVGRFMILELIGAGAMGMVYAAYDPRLDRKVALKLLRPEADPAEIPQLRARLLREAQAMARLEHPNVVTIHDVGESDGGVYLAMELVQGRSVRAWLDEERRPWREVLDVYAQAGRGLLAAHQAGLTHRDFKPDNVLLASDGRVLVSDFGMAALDGELAPAAGPQVSPSLAPTLTQSGTLLGTPAYMPPEQLAGGRGDARGDVYAFATAVWEGVHGRHPFPTDSLDSLRAAAVSGALREPPRHLLPTRVRRALRAALRPDPAARPSLETLVAALAARPAHTAFRAAAGVAVLALSVMLGFAVRAAIVARAETARAREGAELARRVGEEMSALELALRAEKLLPLHDIGPAERRARARLEELRAQLSGGPADAAIHEALGRGYAAIGDDAEARGELEQAAATGAVSVETHYLLGAVLVRLHDATVERARRMGGPSWAAARRAAFASELLAPAREHLQQGRGARRASPRLTEALLAYQAGDLRAALAGARAAAAESPPLFEAGALAGVVLEAQGQAAADAGDRAGAEALYAAAIDELEGAARVARSDPAIHAAIASVWSRRLDLFRFDPDLGRRLARMAGALLATDRQIAARPDSAAGWARRAQVYLLTATGQTGNEAVLASLADPCVAAADAALARDPRDGLALVMKGDCLRHRGGPGDRAASAETLAAALRVSPGFPWAANDLCVVLGDVAQERWQTGHDATGPAREAIAACELSARLDPAWTSPLNNVIISRGIAAWSQHDRGVWDEANARAAEEAARRACAMRGGKDRVGPLVNLLPLAALRVEREPTAENRAELERRAVEVETLAPDWVPGEIEQMLLEARAVSALVDDPRRAGELAGRCLRNDPGRVMCRLLAIRAAWGVGNDRAARDQAAWLVREAPGNARAWAALGESRRRIGDTAGAVAAAVTAVALAPDFPQSTALLANLANR